MFFFGLRAAVKYKDASAALSSFLPAFDSFDVFQGRLFLFLIFFNLKDIKPSNIVKKKNHCQFSKKLCENFCFKLPFKRDVFLNIRDKLKLVTHSHSSF
jgi:hypothetical protein